MESFSFTIRILGFITVICVLSGAGCARDVPKDEMFAPEVLIAAAQAPGDFSGTWDFNLKLKKDGCKLGLGKNLPATVVIAQNGKRGTVTLSGFPSYKARFKKRNVTANGSVKASGTSVRGKIRGRLAKNNEKIKLRSSTFRVNVSGQKCTISFKGVGTRQ